MMTLDRDFTQKELKQERAKKQKLLEFRKYLQEEDINEYCYITNATPVEDGWFSIFLDFIDKLPLTELLVGVVVPIVD